MGDFDPARRCDPLARKSDGDSEMKVGKLARPLVHCAGPPGGPKCKTALIIKEYTQGSAENAWEPGYDVTEYDLICTCGEFGSLCHDVEVIDEDR